METPPDPDKPGLLRKLIDAMSSDDAAVSQETDREPDDFKKFDRDIVPGKLHRDLRANLLNQFNYKEGTGKKARVIRLSFYGLARHLVLMTPEGPESRRSLECLLESRNIALESLSE